MTDIAIEKLADLLQDHAKPVRRGYMGNSKYDQVVQFTVANGILRWDRKYLLTIPANLFLAHVLEASEREGVFRSERGSA